MHVLSPSETPRGVQSRISPSLSPSHLSILGLVLIRSSPCELPCSEILGNTTNMDERRSATPAAQHSAWIARRRRKPLSCTLCRQRKLSCDRERPACSRCRSAGRGDSCTYGERLPNTSRKEGPRLGISEKSRAESPSPVRDDIAPSAPLLSAVAEKNILPLPSPSTAQNNIAWGLPEAHFTGAVAGSARPAIKADLTALSNPGEPKSTEAVIFRGKNYTTQYYGSTNPTSLIGHVRLSYTSLRC